MSHQKGCIYVISSPIGNLQDITYRAIDVLKTMDYILCENTKHSRILLNHYAIDVPVKTLNQHNEHRSKPIFRWLESGCQIGLLSNAGTPCISDPGNVLIHHAHIEGFEVRALPGANAAISSLSICGFPTSRFVFEGFLPHKKKRQKRLQALCDEERTIVLYESSHRIIKLMTELIQVMGKTRWGFYMREMTKKFEESRRGSLQYLYETLMEKEVIKGEFTVVIAGSSFN